MLPCGTSRLGSLAAFSRCEPDCSRFRESRSKSVSYGMGNRKLCWLHLMKGSIDVTFTLSEGDESRLGKSGRVAGAIARSLLEGQRTGPVKWCWLELSDRRTIDAFLSLARRKAEWLNERPAPRRAPRLHRGRGSEGAAETD